LFKVQLVDGAADGGRQAQCNIAVYGENIGFCGRCCRLCWEQFLQYYSIRLFQTRFLSRGLDRGPPSSSSKLADKAGLPGLGANALDGALLSLAVPDALMAIRRDRRRRHRLT
jgi:hypothetical protein